MTQEERGVPLGQDSTIEEVLKAVDEVLGKSATDIAPEVAPVHVSPNGQTEGTIQTLPHTPAVPSIKVGLNTTGTNVIALHSGPSVATQPSTPSQATTYTYTRQYYNYCPLVEDRKQTVELGLTNSFMPSFFVELLQNGCPHPKEKAAITPIVIREAKHFAKAIEIDDKGNVFVEVVSKQGVISETIFSCHMDTVHRDVVKVTPMVTTPEAKLNAIHPDGAGFIYAAEKKVKQEFVDLNACGGKHNMVILAQDLPKYIKKHWKSEKWQMIEFKEGNDVCEKMRAQYPGKPKTYQVKLLDKGNEFAKSLILLRKEPEIKFSSSVLGADDKVGVYLCLRMIKAKIPGMYIFHVGEEHGGVGSKFIAANGKDFLKKYKRAIALDRAGYTDVLTHQGGTRGCSDEFGNALAKALNGNGIPPASAYKISTGGVYTDTREYFDIIPECTNISVGYFNQHGHSEHFDAVFVEKMLLPALLKVDWENLPTVRDPAKPVYKQDNNWEKGWQTGRIWCYTTQNWMDNPKDAAGNSKYIWSTKERDYAPNPAYKEAPKSTGKVTKITRFRPDGTSYTIDLKSSESLSKEPANVGRVLASEVKKDTPLDKIPIWFPSDGLIQDTSEASMVSIIAAYLEKNCYTNVDLAQELYKAFINSEKLSAQCDNLEAQVEDYKALEEVYWGYTGKHH